MCALEHKSSNYWNNVLTMTCLTLPTLLNWSLMIRVLGGCLSLPKFRMHFGWITRSLYNQFAMATNWNSRWGLSVVLVIRVALVLACQKLDMACVFWQLWSLQLLLKLHLWFNVHYSYSRHCNMVKVSMVSLSLLLLQLWSLQ